MYGRDLHRAFGVFDVLEMTIFSRDECTMLCKSEKKQWTTYGNWNCLANDDQREDHYFRKVLLDWGSLFQDTVRRFSKLLFSGPSCSSEPYSSLSKFHGLM
ncbi:hypothetical protein FRX31_008494, partial [Thalictrum thalictroides]